MWHELKLLAVVVAVVVCFIGGFFYVKIVFKSPPSNLVPQIFEDNCVWNCRTMGNGVCGNGK